jgi:IS30 family transposase
VDQEDYSTAQRKWEQISEKDRYKFETSICTKTVYNMIDRGDFLRLSNKDLLVKRDGQKRRYQISGFAGWR